MCTFATVKNEHDWSGGLRNLPSDDHALKCPRRVLVCARDLDRRARVRPVKVTCQRARVRTFRQTRVPRPDFLTFLTNAGCHDHDAALTAYSDVVLVERGQASVRVLGRCAP